MRTPTPNAWIEGEPHDAARVRLFCLPYAGGGASAFRPWRAQLPAAIDLCPIQLPGRERRFAEPPCTQLHMLVEAIARAVRPHLDLPYAIFGHSLGALIAFELTRALRRAGAPAPIRLFLSALQPPQELSLRARDRHRLSDDDLMTDLRAFGGTPARLLADRELMQLLLPVVRADFTLLETHRHAPEAPLETSIAAFAGDRDAEAPPDSMEGWRAHAAGAFELSVLPGDHFYLHAPDARPLLLDALTRDLFDAVAHAA